MSEKKNSIERKTKSADRQEKPTEKRKRRFSIGKQLKDLVSGEFLSGGYIERNLPFLGFLTVIMLCYIGYQYYVDNTIRQQAKQDKEHAELYSKLQSVKEEFNSNSLQSIVAEGTAAIGMYESVDPPTAIPVEKDEIKE